MTYSTLIIANLVLGAFAPQPLAFINLFSAAFVAGLWLAEIVNSKTASD